MSEQATLLTQSEIGRINEVLNTLSNNLFFHRNGSLAKGHGISLITGDYFDSGGDQISSYVLRMSVETTPGNLEVVYVPADAAATYNAKVPVGGATVSGEMPASLGVFHTGTGPDGSVNSPGVPQLASSLLTRYSETLLQDLLIADQLLKAHALLNHGEKAPTPHYGILTTDEDFLDSLGHIVGRKAVKMTFGNRQYKLAGDQNITGPPQAPRITSQPVDQQTKASSEPLPTRTFSVVAVTPDIPITYQWQIATLNVTSKLDPLLLLDSNWTNMTDGSDYDSPRFTGAQVKALSGATSATFSAQNIHVGSGHSNEWLGEDEIPCYVFRCKVMAATGGITYSVAAKLKCFDKT